MHSFPELSIDRWRLRPLEHQDAEPWLSIVLDPELRRLTSWNVDTLEEMQRNVASYIDGPKALTTRRWAIVDANDMFCGTCGFKDWERVSQSAEIAFELASEQRGRGAMSVIAAAVIEHGFEEMDLQVIRALAMVENAPSNRLLTKLGFRRTATLPALRKCGGVLRDFFSYELVRR